MNYRASILFIVVGVFLLAVSILPDIPSMKPSRLERKLPEYLGDWIGAPREPRQIERDILADDTEFVRMSYTDQTGQLPQVEASIVFSGKSLAQSIHRPEICWRGAGWKFHEENYYSWDGLLPLGERFSVKEVIASRVRIVKSDSGENQPALSPKGQPIVDWNAFYYTFVGHTVIVSGHYERNLHDIKDRLLRGYDQSWAYITLGTPILGRYAEQGLDIAGMREMDIEHTRMHIKSFVKQLMSETLMPFSKP